VLTEAVELALLNLALSPIQLFARELFSQQPPKPQPR
jgi:hypothetical protein